MSTRYIRSTHDENGRFRPFPTEAQIFWREQGEVIGNLLRLETPLTFTELCHAYEEAVAEQIAVYHDSELLTINLSAMLCEVDIAWCLFQLLVWAGNGRLYYLHPTQSYLSRIALARFHRL